MYWSSAASAGRLQLIRLAAHNREVMMRGTFGNIRLKNMLVPGEATMQISPDRRW
jgi:aconitase A